MTLPVAEESEESEMLEEPAVPAVVPAVVSVWVDGVLDPVVPLALIVDEPSVMMNS